MRNLYAFQFLDFFEKKGPQILLHDSRSVIRAGPELELWLLTSPSADSFTWQATAAFSGFRIQRNGDLTPASGSPFVGGLNPISVALDFFGRFLYSVNGGGNNVSAYRVEESGFLVPVPGSPFPTGIGPAFVAISP